MRSTWLMLLSKYHTASLTWTHLLGLRKTKQMNNKNRNRAINGENGWWLPEGVGNEESGQNGWVKGNGRYRLSVME